MSEFHSVALIGHGRFGAAFAGLLSRHGIAWRALDPRGSVPAGHAETDLARLVAAADLVVVAVPVPAIESALVALRPHLGARHTVIDVGSVKLQPCAWLDRHLGDAVAHAGTHPLFGPLSLARADPIRSVICPSPRHPETARRVRRFFEALGSEIIERDAASHDRAMASTHAMAFFVAKGLLDIGAADDLGMAPPSFRALAQSIEAVRADAGHLFAAIQRENPFAEETRARFIEALRGIHERLSQPAASGSSPGDAAIPGLDSEPREDVQAHLADLDRELATLLERRRQLEGRLAGGVGEQADLREPASLRTVRGKS